MNKLGISCLALLLSGALVSCEPPAQNTENQDVKSNEAQVQSSDPAVTPDQVESNGSDNSVAAENPAAEERVARTSEENQSIRERKEARRKESRSTGANTKESIIENIASSIKSRLELNDDQYNQAKEILNAEFKSQFGEPRDSYSVSEARDISKKLKKGSRDAVFEILTPEQKENMEKHSR